VWECGWVLEEVEWEKKKIIRSGFPNEDRRVRFCGIPYVEEKTIYPNICADEQLIVNPSGWRESGEKEE